MSTAQKNTPKNQNPSARAPGAKSPVSKQTAEPVQPQSVQQGETSTSNVGLMLKKTRLKYNLTLQDVSNYLNIRRGQIESIEEGRFHELPATAYAVGFIKSYSSYLGLDPDLMVDRFKQETGKQVQKIDFDIPAPLHESRLPDQKIVIASIAATLVFVALLFFVFRDTNQNQEIISEVPDVEDVFKQDVANQLNATGVTAATPPTLPSADGLVQQQAQTTEGTVADGQNQMQDQAALATGSTVIDATQQTPEQQAQAQQTLGTDASAQGVTSQVVVVDENQQAAPTDATAPTEETAATEATQTAENSLLDAEKRATVYGAGNVNSRISIKAKQNSWIEIKDGRNNILLSRVLKPDDVYYVPADTKTFLTTGNAGGLDVYIDNKFAGVAGKPGEVLRNYQISIDGLIAP